MSRSLVGIRVKFRGAPVGEPFQVNYVESTQDAERRFRPWLDRTLARAITLWRESL